MSISTKHHATIVYKSIISPYYEISPLISDLVTSGAGGHAFHPARPRTAPSRLPCHRPCPFPAWSWCDLRVPLVVPGVTVDRQEQGGPWTLATPWQRSQSKSEGAHTCLNDRTIRATSRASFDRTSSFMGSLQGLLNLTIIPRRKAIIIPGRMVRHTNKLATSYLYSVGAWAS